MDAANEINIDGSGEAVLSELDILCTFKEKQRMALKVFLSAKVLKLFKSLLFKVNSFKTITPAVTLTHTIGLCFWVVSLMQSAEPTKTSRTV